MNQLPLHKRVQIINLLVEGNSLRSTSRIADVSINTVTKLLVDVGSACQKFHDEMARNLTTQRVQCDEIWSFVYAKQKNVPEGMDGAGDVWTWVGIDADSKFVISWLVGNRDSNTANIFMQDIAIRLKDRVQLMTDGLKCYLEAVDVAFEEQIDFAQLVKLYGPDPSQSEKRYSPAQCTGAVKMVVTGKPKEKFISTSYIERQNLTMRMQMRRFTRLTNGFSKKIENHCYAIALHFVYYNFVKIHKSLSVPPAMQIGLVKRLMSIDDIVDLAK